MALAGPAASAGTVAEPARPDLVKVLAGFDELWTPDPANPLRGTVDDPAVLQYNDQLAVWINRSATPAQRFAALQDTAYGSLPDGYDQSITIATGLGSLLGPLYVQGWQSGALPLTSALTNSTTGSAGSFVGTGDAKNTFAYPRPYLPADPTMPANSGDDPACAPASTNSASLRGNRIGKTYVDAGGNLSIMRVPAAVDTTHEFSSRDVALDPGYGSPAVCRTGSFPSGHAATAFQAGVTLATLLPELGPEILARTSESGNNRSVLGVHYPLDLIGGRMVGEAAIAALWSDEQFRTTVLDPARRELVGYLEDRCGAALAECIAKQTSYRSDPYGGAAMPGGTPQVVTDRATAVAVAGERLSYGFPRTGPTELDPSVPPDAQNLLRTTFPQLTDAQRRSVLAHTQIGSGYPLDLSGSAAGSWQRLNLAAAMSATVQLEADGGLTVVSVGGPAQVLPAGVPAGPVPSATAGSATSDESSPAPWSAWFVAGGLLLILVGGGMVVLRRPRRGRAG